MTSKHLPAITRPFVRQSIIFALITMRTSNNDIFRAIPTTTRKRYHMIDMIMMRIQFFIAPITFSLLCFILTLNISHGVFAAYLSFSCISSPLHCIVSLFIVHSPGFTGACHLLLMFLIISAYVLVRLIPMLSPKLARPYFVLFSYYFKVSIAIYLCFQAITKFADAFIAIFASRVLHQLIYANGIATNATNFGRGIHSVSPHYLSAFWHQVARVATFRPVGLDAMLYYNGYGGNFQ